MNSSTPTQSEACQQLTAQLSDYLDGILSQEDCDRLEDHIDQCQDCKVLASTLKRTIELFQQLEQPTLPEQAVDRLLDRLEESGCLKMSSKPADH